MDWNWRDLHRRGTFQPEAVLPLDAQEFNPQVGCVAGFNWGDYKKIERPDGMNGNTISGDDSIDMPNVLPPKKRRTLSCSPWRKGILEK
jgi:hypothetical protein